MADTITACENVCHDFAWIGPLTDWAANVGLLLGVLIAWRQLEAWRREQSARRKAEVAEELVFLAHHAEDAFKHIRNPFDRVPEEEANRKGAFYERRYKRIHEYNELFKDLRAYQVRATTLIGDKAVHEAVDALFSARQKVLIALELLFDLQFEDGPARSKEERDTQISLRREISGSFSQRDELGGKILDAVKTIDDRLTPVARLARTRSEK